MHNDIWAKYCGNVILAHHGIKGQKWGIRNGPPYPIDRNKAIVPVSLKLTAQDGVKVTSISSHAADQARDRNVSTKEIVDAVKNPLYIIDRGRDELGRPTTRYIGSSATVNVNPDNGTVSTVWKTSHRIRNKYSEGG